MTGGRPGMGAAALTFEVYTWNGTNESAMELKQWAEGHGIELGLYDGAVDPTTGRWRRILGLVGGSLLPGHTALWVASIPGLRALTPEQARPWLHLVYDYPTTPAERAEYTPTTSWLRIMVGYAMTTAADRTLPVEEARAEGYRWFDRWLAARDRGARQALVVADAWNNPGPERGVHERAKRQLRLTWPTLARAISDLANAHRKL